LYTDPQKAGEAPRKFMFDRSFDDATVVHRAQERKPVLMKPEQIDALRKEGFDAGFDAGKQADKDEQMVRLSLLMTLIEENITAVVARLDQMAREQEVNARHLVLAIAKKLLPTFTAQNGMQEIEALLAETLREMVREPRLVVRVHEGQFDIINERIQAIAVQRAYPGKVIVLADDDVAAGDCRVEWADGGVERNTQATWRAVEQTIIPT
jgi:flagellar assembly protein FliH